MGDLILLLEMAGTVAFAISGALVGISKKMDAFGVSILGISTAVGGGVIRDLIIGITPPNIFQKPGYIVVAAIASLIIFLPRVRKCFARHQESYDRIMLIMDSVGLAVFTVMGIRVAKMHTETPTLFLLTFVGLITGVGGGLLRDVFSGNVPYIFVKHIYAVASMIGALICTLTWEFVGELTALLLGIFTILVIRGFSAHFHWNLPRSEGEDS